MKISADKKYSLIWHPYTQILENVLPVNITKGNGAYLYDENGNRYIDAISSWWTNIHGHSHPHIIKKISEQIAALDHVIFAGFTHPKAEELARRLTALLPLNLKKVFFSDNGSTAVETALKMSLQYWQNMGKPRKKIVALSGAFHGDTFGAMALSDRGIFTAPFINHLFDVVRISAPVKGKERDSFVQLKEAIRQNPSDIAAFFFEQLIQGAAGMVMYEPEPLDELIRLCKANDIITVADEVMTGFGRTGKMFACEYLLEKPDLICLAKGLTGGVMTMGVTVCSEKIYNAFISDDMSKTFFHGHSYTGNPVACAAACASLDLFEKPETWSSINRIESRHLDFFEKIKSHPSFKEVRIRGTVIALELNTKEKTSYLNPLRNYINDYFLKRRIILRPLGNVIYILPPYCITDYDLTYIYKEVENFLGEFVKFH